MTNREICKHCHEWIIPDPCAGTDWSAGCGWVAQVDLDSHCPDNSSHEPTER